MPKAQQTLANALERVHNQAANQIVRSSEISRQDRELLARRGFLVEIIKGWYALVTPQADLGETTFWHAHFWNFISVYLKQRFGSAYCLSAEHSLDLLTGNTQTPSQLIVISSKGGASTIQLPNKTSLLVYPDKKNLPKTTVIRQGIQTMPLAIALARVGPAFFRESATNAEIALRLAQPAELSRILLEESSTLAAAGRLIGALRHCSQTEQADSLTADLTAAGFDLVESNPFEKPPYLSSGTHFTSPYVARIEALWKQMSPIAHSLFPKPPLKTKPQRAYLSRIDELYVQDAYHSLSIEGYRVSPELIAKIKGDEWDPKTNANDQAHVNAMAAKGYHEAFLATTASIGKILNGQNAATTIEQDLPSWYRSLFSPSVQAQLIPTHALAGYRNRPIFIKGSEHVPPPSEALPELLDAYFKLLSNEKSPAAKAILGHFMFVHIHPYSDGNGRIGRFIMNALLAEGGYPWTVIRVEHRNAYMSSLEEASIRNDISAFTRFLAEEMQATDNA